MGALVLVGTLLYAAVRDWRAREVEDATWLVAGLLGTAVGAFAFLGGPGRDLLLWLVVGAFVLQHLLPWDAALERVAENLPGAVEAVAYVAVGLLLGAVGLSSGIGTGGVPVAVLAAYVSVLFARVLFELNVLYGGADAKALMVAGLVVPLWPRPLLPVPASASSLLGFYPFALTLLMDAALFAAAIPIGLAVRNAARGSFEFPRGFTGYRLPVAELPRRFVWLHDPTFRPDPEAAAVETAEEDVALRRRQADALRAQGVREVWVTPQLPFVVLLAAGAVAGLVAGNLVFDLLALL